MQSAVSRIKKFSRCWQIARRICANTIVQGRLSLIAARGSGEIWKVSTVSAETTKSGKLFHTETRICAAEMAVRYAALSACLKVHVCHCNSLGGATWRSVTITGRTDRQTDRQTDRVRRNMRPPPREEGRIIILFVKLNLRMSNCIGNWYAESMTSFYMPSSKQACIGLTVVTVITIWYLIVSI